jgi:predicted GNAT family acetyltransferase
MLGEKLGEVDARAIFEKYGEVVSGLSEIEKMIPDGPEKNKLVEEAKENLLRRARKLIEDFAEKQKKAMGDGETLDSKEIMEKLSRVSAYNQSYLSAFKATQRNNPWLTFEDFKDFEFGEEFVFDLDGHDLSRMIEIYEENYKGTPKFQKKLLIGFGETISKLSQPIQILRHKGKIVGFYLYTPRQDGGLDFRSFNVDPAYSGAGLGKAMMNQELQDRALNDVIHATCTAQLPISSEYIESGFVGIGHGNSEEINYLEIVRNDRKRYFATKEWYERKHFDPAVEGKKETNNDWTYIVAEKDVNKLPFDLAGKEENGYVYVLTRYLRPEKGYPNHVLVFEKTEKSQLKNYQTLRDMSRYEKPMIF